MLSPVPQKRIASLEEFKQYIATHPRMGEVVVQRVDFSTAEINWEEVQFDSTVFLACKFKKKDSLSIIQKGAFVYPKFQGLPYQPYRTNLYRWQELLKGYSLENDQSTDLQIYKHFVKRKYNSPVNEAMAQRIHDHNIDIALRELLEYDDQGIIQKKAVGFMGGHSTRRNSPMFKKVAICTKLATEKGFYVVSGGGPGIMEAANLGAYFAGKDLIDLDKSIAILSDLTFSKGKEVSLDYLATNYIVQAQEVLDIYPNGAESLAIPTWFYGHEPSNLFASNIAKYFSNSIREDTLLSICLHGIVFAPGSAGTTQEIFQEAAQNHYGTMDYYSPMVFLGKERYIEETSIYSLLHQLSKGQVYNDLLYLTDSPKEVVSFLEKHPPIKK